MPLPQRTNDPIISIRSLDWCYTPFPFTLSPSVSFSPHIQSLSQEPPGWGGCAPSSTVQYVQRWEVGGIEGDRGGGGGGGYYLNTTSRQRFE